MFVRQILSNKGDAIVSIQPSARISDIATLMSRERIGAVVVLDAVGQLAGIVSLSGILRVVLPSTAPHSWR